MTNLTSILEELVTHCDNVRAEFDYTDDIHRNIDLQIEVAHQQIIKLILSEEEEIEKIVNHYCQRIVDEDKVMLVYWNVAKAIRSQLIKNLGGEV